MIETARRQPRAETLEAIAKAFGISVDDIHGGPRPEPPPPLAPDQLKAIREAAREGAAQSELTLEQRVLLRHFGSAGAERQALALWILSEDPHYLQEFEAAALERGREATSLSDALTGLISQSKKSLG